MIKQLRTYHKFHTESILEIEGWTGDQIHVLEDIGRPAGIKIPQWTCIPEGKYKAKVTMSTRFGKNLVVLYNQKNGYEILSPEGVSWTGIRAHDGISAEHTHGCLLTNYHTDGNGKMWGGASDDLVEFFGDSIVDWEIVRV